jgi:hypothetical protein
MVQRNNGAAIRHCAICLLLQWGLINRTCYDMFCLFKLLESKCIMCFVLELVIYAMFWVYISKGLNALYIMEPQKRVATDSLAYCNVEVPAFNIHADGAHYRLPSTTFFMVLLTCHQVIPSSSLVSYCHRGLSRKNRMLLPQHGCAV